MPDELNLNAITPLSFEDWVANQPGQGQITPASPQGNDYWQEAYMDYYHNFQQKFDTSGDDTGPGSEPISNWDIGKFKGQGRMGKPSVSKLNNFMKDNEKVWEDHDVYLWGSFPDNKNTQDIDLLVHNPKGFTTQEMEDITVSSLENSLTKNQFLADIGFTDAEKMYDFNKAAYDYEKTGKQMKTNGYIYGTKWKQDDKTFRDRMKYSEGYIEPLDNNMYKKTSYLPYPKMVNNLKKNKNYYKDKPMKIKERKRNY
jgi:hypothetical protein